MNGYNSNYYNRNLLDSLSRVIQEDVFRLDSPTVDAERKRKLQQAQQAAQQAERDPETGLLKTSGAITGVPKSEPGGDLYGVDPQGRAFVVTAKKKQTAPTSPSPTASTSSSFSSPATITRNWGTGSTQNFNDMSKVPSVVDRAKSAFDVGTLQTRAVEADRQRRIDRAQAMANFTPGFGKGMGEGDTDIVPLRASDIRPTSSISNTVQPPSAAPLVARTNQLGTPALERIRADEMDPRIQRQKARIAAAEAERKKAYAKSVTQHPSNWVPRLY